MIRFGRCTAEQDAPAHRWWRRGLIAASLLPQTSSPSREEVDRFERIMDKFNQSNETDRTTGRNRLVTVDNEVLPLLQSLFPLETRLFVQDWAASSGITAAEWYQSLQRLYPSLSFVASDSILYLVELRREKERDAFILEPDGKAIQYIRAPFVVSLVKKHHSIYFINRVVQRRALREWKRVSASFCLSPDSFDGNGAESISAPPYLLRRLSLIHPEVIKIQSERFQVKQHSVFRPLSRPVHVIRTMNILNRSYFTVSQLQTAAAAVKQSLHPRGLWIVGRTMTDDPPKHDVTVFRKSDCGWQTVMRLGNGSEMESLTTAAIEKS